MRKYILLLLLIISVNRFVSGQVLCIYCYNQNDSISNGVKNLIKNGSFEDGNCNASNYYFCPKSTSHNCDITNWTCTGGGTATYAMVYNRKSPISNVEKGNFAVYFGNYFCNACSPTVDDTSCVIRTGCTVTGIPKGYPINPNIGYGGDTGLSISQNVTGLTAGSIYVLEFWAGGEGETYFIHEGIFGVDVGFGNIVLSNMASDSTTLGIRFIIEFRATSTSHTIKFTNWGHICSTCTELALDDVKLYTQSELAASVPHCLDTTGTLPPDTTPIIIPESIHYFNVFTPNGDGKNDLFTVSNTGYKTLNCKIYNRWGQMVYEWNGITGGWNGKINGNKASDGVYFYIVTAEKLTGGITQQKGFLQLINGN